jgi:hypothetical protein
MKIGELARATGTAVQTIRYYEQQGLLPSTPRSGGNYPCTGCRTWSGWPSCASAVCRRGIATMHGAHLPISTPNNKPPFSTSWMKGLACCSRDWHRQDPGAGRARGLAGAASVCC